MVEADLLDDVIDQAGDGGVQLTGEGGFLPEMAKASSNAASEVGDVALARLGDRAESFELRRVPQHSRRLGGLDEMIISLYVGGMVIRDNEDKGAGPHAKKAGTARGKHRAPGRLVEKPVTQGWKAALNALAIAHPGRLNRHIN